MRMESDEQWVFECNIEIKSEPDDPSYENNEADALNETRTTSCAVETVHTDKSISYDSYYHKNDGKKSIIELGENNDDGDKMIETEHNNALRSNINNSKELLQGIYILETQRIQAIKELDELYELQEQALSGPNAFVEKLQNHNIDLSASSDIHEFPDIDWNKYRLNFNTARIRRQQSKLADLIQSVGGKRRSYEDKCLRQKERQEKRNRLHQNKRSREENNLCPNRIPEEDNSLCQNERPDEDSSLSQDERPKQRRKLWSAEEQRTLEKLLLQFPPEETERRRFEKIANFLEDRTPGQVTGRVKKYFQILKKHGIAVKNGMPPTGYVKKPCSCVMGPNPNTMLISHLPPTSKPDGNERKSNILQAYRRRNKLIKHSFKFWTDEEQKKLDDLLIQYPPEEVVSSRWEKIAKHFTNRSPFQIAGRVNYLKRLMINGLFVPGKIPCVQHNEISSTEMRYSHGSNIRNYWTPEEQERLEELLVIFPPEEHENERWKKIASYLKNRTPAQVYSRAKNYFVKCKRSGMPVPGRVPRISYQRLKFNKKACKLVHNSSTISESPQQSITVENCKESEMDASRQMDINIELELMEKAMKEKRSSRGFAHIGFQCSKCKVKPIVGIRWHCTVCISQSVDFCSVCSESECKELDEHSIDHTLVAIQAVTN